MVLVFGCLVFGHAMQMRRPRGSARKARIHTGEVRRPQYELDSLINEVRIAPDACGAAAGRLTAELSPQPS
jgi:hypothetical protein